MYAIIDNLVGFLITHNVIHPHVPPSQFQPVEQCYDYSSCGAHSCAQGRGMFLGWGLFSVDQRSSPFWAWMILEVQNCEFINLTGLAPLVFCCGQSMCNHLCRGWSNSSCTRGFPWATPDMKHWPPTLFLCCCLSEGYVTGLRSVFFYFLQQTSQSFTQLNHLHAVGMYSKQSLSKITHFATSVNNRH